MEICIERYDYAATVDGFNDDRLVRRTAEAHFTDVPDIETALPEGSRGTARQTLIEQKPRQAASRLTTSSST